MTGSGLSRHLALVSLYASLYAAVTVFQWLVLGPLVYGPIQVRLSDALLLMPMLHGLPAALGLGLGCAIANAFVLGNPLDVVLGSLANVAAGVVAYRARRLNPVIVGLIVSLIVAVIVGSYLPLVVPELFEAYGARGVAALMLSYGGVLAGEIVAVVVVGVPLYRAVARALGA